MPHTPTVSIITAVYNAAPYLADTLNSVAAQTIGDWEHLIVDDASTDGSAAIAGRYSARDPRFVLIEQRQNAGALTARNRGLELARGRFVAFLDADDLWLPEKLACQLAFMEETGASISHTAYRRMSADGGGIGPLILPPRRLTYSDLLKNTAIAMSAGMLDTAQLGQLTIPLGGHRSMRSDLRFWLNALRGGAVAHGLPEDLMRYRVVPGSLSRNPLRSAYWVWHAYRQGEGLGRIAAAWNLSHYAARALRRRL